MALWLACKNVHHCMEHWCMLPTFANSSTPCTDISLQKRVLELEKRLKKRSRSPRRSPGQPLQIANSIPPPALLALPAPQKGTKGNGKVKGKGTQAPQTTGLHIFKANLKLGGVAKKQLLQRRDGGSCWRFQSKMCAGSPCTPTIAQDGPVRRLRLCGSQEYDE